MSNEESEFWQAHKEEMKAMREKRMEQSMDDIEILDKEGIRATFITPWQIRFEECIDIWPSNKNFHVLDTGERGRYKRMAPFLRSFFTENCICSKCHKSIK